MLFTCLSLDDQFFEDGKHNFFIDAAMVGMTGEQSAGNMCLLNE